MPGLTPRMARVKVDTRAALTWSAGQIGGKGAIPWREPGDHRVELLFTADTPRAHSIAYVDTGSPGPVTDTLANDRPT